MNTGFNIIELYNPSCNRIIDIILPIQQQEFNVPITIGDQPDLLDIEEYYHKTGGGFWGAEHDGKLVGTIGLIGIGNHAGVLRKMFVAQEYRGGKFSIAQLLLNCLIEYCRCKDINDIFLGTINTMKAAQRFYERNGFKEITKGDLPANYLLMRTDNMFYHLRTPSKT